MAHVIVLDSLCEDIFVCGLCKLVFNSLELFLVHKRVQCKREDKVDSDGESLKKDMVVEVTTASEYFSAVTGNEKQEILISSEKQNRTEKEEIFISSELTNFVCAICNKVFKKAKFLNAHLKSHERSSQCRVCGRCFNNNSHLNRHIASHKVWPDGLSETTPKSSEVDLLSYSCPYCETVLSNYSQFRVHLSRHLSLKKYKCIQDCNSFFESIEDLLSHVTNVHDILKYTCHLCKQLCSSLGEIANHYEGHDKAKDVARNKHIDKFKCEHCDATFRKREKLSLHTLTENHSKTCIHCNKTFASDKRLRLHLHTHMKSKPYVCNICCSSFHMKKHLTSHMLKHGESQFICKICKHSFKRHDCLQRHIKSHHMKKGLKCPFKDILECNKEFSRRDKLNDHVKSHAKNIKGAKLLPVNKMESVMGSDTGTVVEICIVPLDTN